LVKTSDANARFLKFFDIKVIDFLGPRVISSSFSNAFTYISKIHNGIINFYAYIMVASCAACLSYLVYIFAQG